MSLVAVPPRPQEYVAPVASVTEPVPVVGEVPSVPGAALGMAVAAPRRRRMEPVSTPATPPVQAEFQILGP